MIGALPDELIRNVVGAWGDDGVRWLAELPAIVQQLAQVWDLTIGAPFELSYHYVAAVTCADGTPAVLKLGVPDGGSLASEAPALAAFDGQGAVRLLRADLARGALLLERVAPGTRLRELVPAHDAEATSVLAGLMRRLHVPPPFGCPLPDVRTKAEAFDEYLALYGEAGPLPRALVVRAARLIRELCASAPAAVVLHGDLHHDNILSATRAPWLAIDPKGVVGEPAYEVGALLRNPLPQLLAMPNPGRVTARRVDQLAEALGIDRARIRGWGLAQAVLSAWWSIEDSGYGWESTIACAELLAAVKA